MIRRWSATVFAAAVTLLFLGGNTVYDGGGGSFTGWGVYGCTLVGLLVTGCLMWITDYYTGTNHRPVQKIAQASTTGHATNIIQGLAVSMEACGLPVLVISMLASLVFRSVDSSTGAFSDEAIAKRLKPVGEVVVGPADAVTATPPEAATAVAAAPAPAAAAAKPAAGASISSSAIPRRRWRRRDCRPGPFTRSSRAMTACWAPPAGRPYGA